MRKVVFLGNCYAGVLNQIYSWAIAPLMNDISSFAPFYDKSDANKKTIEEADVIVLQIFVKGEDYPVDPYKTGAKIITFPTVSFNTLWPYGGGGHIFNKPRDYWPCGPYDYNMGDTYLNKLISAGIPPEEAADSYINMNIAKIAHLDRTHEIVMDRQRALDEKTDMHFADEVEEHFRNEFIFLNHNRLNVRLCASLTRQVFKRLGVNDPITENVIAHWRRTPFEQVEVPIHPGVAAHFNLSYGHEGYKYYYHTGEMITFNEFAYRYATFQYNESLLKGVATDFWGGGEVFTEFHGHVSPERVQEVVADLRTGLIHSNGSARGYRALAKLLDRQGHTNAAIITARKSIAFRPGEGEGHELLGRLLIKVDKQEEAEQILRLGVTADPWHSDNYSVLAELLEQQGRNDEAISFLENLVSIRPGFAFWMGRIGELYLKKSDYQKAESWLKQSVDREPYHPRYAIPLLRILKKNKNTKEFNEYANKLLDVKDTSMDMIKEIIKISLA